MAEMLALKEAATKAITDTPEEVEPPSQKTASASGFSRLDKKKNKNNS
jgi:hypothetical protein